MSHCPWTPHTPPEHTPHAYSDTCNHHQFEDVKAKVMQQGQ